MPINQGSWWLIRYHVPGPPIWHSRLAILENPNQPTQVFICTPDGDTYVEQLVISADNAEVVQLAAFRTYPAHVPAAQVHEFIIVPDAARRATMSVAACVEFAIPITADVLSWDPLGLAAPGAIGPAAAAGGGGLGGLMAALGPAPGPGVGGGLRHLPAPPAVAAAGAAGALVPAAPAAAAVAIPGAPAPALAAVGVPPAAPAPVAAVPAAFVDARVCDIAKDALGNRFRDFREATNLLAEDGWPDWPITGPRTTRWLCQYFIAQGHTPLTWFARFKADGGLTFQHEGIEELERNCKILTTSLCYDQLNGSNLASLEFVSRAIQVTSHSYRHLFGGGREDAFERSLMFGSSLSDASVPLSPLLREHMATELARRNALDKERRKAQETRNALGSDVGGGGRGRSRGNKGGRGAQGAKDDGV